ncbi:Uncharacterised protein [Malacoplasma iowae]|nr:Uncharacterised protein [Mycoplasmopsis fermentans]VEU71926.1 Uncharacterised protein [Malacoplasma iowae]
MFLFSFTNNLNLSSSLKVSSNTITTIVVSYPSSLSFSKSTSAKTSPFLRLTFSLPIYFDLNILLSSPSSTVLTPICIN